MTPQKAGQYDRTLGKMLQNHELSGNQHAILNRMFWTLRSKGSDRTQVTIDTIAMRTGSCRESVMQAIRRGIALGLVERIKTQIRRAIGPWVRVVNGANIYVFKLPEIVTESTEQTTILKDRIDYRDDDGGGAGSGQDAERDEGRSDADSMGGGVSDEPGATGSGEGVHQPEAGGDPGPDSGQASGGSWRSNRGMLTRETDLLEARRIAMKESMLDKALARLARAAGFRVPTDG